RRPLRDARPARRRAVRVARSAQLRPPRSPPVARPRVPARARRRPMTTGTTDPPIPASDPIKTGLDGEVRRTSTSEPIVTAPGDDGRWYKDAVIYQLHVRAFFDSDGDGIGDFRGLAQKLDYIQDL